jgi:hypothetical protein
MKNFAKLKDSLYTEVLNCLKEDRTKAKKLIGGYTSILKNNATLQEALHIHNNLEKGTFKNEDVKHGFIIENLNAIRRLDKEELRLGLEELDNFLKGNQIQYSTDLNVLSEKISNLMLNINKVDKSVENNLAIEYIIETVSNRKPSENNRKPISHKLFKEAATKNYNEKFADLSETEKKIVKSFFTGNKEKITEQYNTLTYEIKSVIDSKITATDDKDIKIKFYEVKDRLTTVPEDITLEHFKKLLELKENLG